MATLVAGFGYPLRVAPYINNGNYHYLTMLVACKKAEEVPFYLKLNVNPRKKDIRVQLEGWLSHQRDQPPQPPYHGDDNQDRRDRGRREQRDRSGGARFHSPRRSPVGRRHRDQDGGRYQRNDGSHSSIGSNRSRAAQDWIDDLRVKLVAAGLLQDEGQVQQGGRPMLTAPGPVVMASAEQREMEKGKSIDFSSPDTGKFTNDKMGAKVLFSQTMISDGKQIYTGTLAVATHEHMPNGGFKFVCFEKGVLNENMNSVEYIQETQMGYHMVHGNGTVGSNRASLQLIEEGNNSGVGMEQGQESVMSQFDLEQQVVQGVGHKEKGENQGPPPGFEFLASIAKEGPQMGQCSNAFQAPQEASIQQMENTETQQVRKSRRLLEKYSEGRLKYDSGKRKYNKNNVKLKPVNLEYQQTLDPLNKDQAEKVIKLAGVQMRGKIEEEIEKIVFK